MTAIHFVYHDLVQKRVYYLLLSVQHRAQKKVSFIEGVAGLSADTVI